MPEMLEEVLAYLRNWFMVKKVNGTFTIDKGIITFPEDAPVPEPEQYLRIFGSIFNDGLHMMCDDSLNDEVFEGTIWYLAVPTPVVQIAMQVQELVEQSATANPMLKSESFDGYSYTRMTRADGTVMDWRDVFHDKLARWRKI
jgi:hypothetical protein